MKRAAGILLPLFSLPSKYGIGSLGKSAYEFVDFLVKANQSYWQLLPLTPTSYGDSPYQSFSSFAGNPYFIDLEVLVEQGMLSLDDLPKETASDSLIDYGEIYISRNEILYKAYKNSFSNRKEEFEKFYSENNWLKDYGLFMALKKHFDMTCWQDWPDENIRLRKKEAMEYYQNLLKDDILFYQYEQFLFYEQFNKLKQYAHDNGILLIGDLPIYSPLDSVDVWANSDQFQLDENLCPRKVAGVPPDYFSKDGQLWGNPLYDWDKMKENGYKYWIERVDGTSKLYDVIRIDHFRGFESYWSIDASETTAKNGEWIKGPGYAFVKVIRDWFNQVQFIAEDLGEITEDVHKLIKDSGFPGMRVIEFGLDPSEDSCNRPCNYDKNVVCYPGTHDNVPLMGWFETASKKEVEYAKKYFKLDRKEGYNWGIIRGGLASSADLFICQFQDYLGKGQDARINVPSTCGNNWRYRINEQELSDKLAIKIADLTKIYQRHKKIEQID